MASILSHLWSLDVAYTSQHHCQIQVHEYEVQRGGRMTQLQLLPQSQGYAHLRHDRVQGMNIYKMWMGWLAKAKDSSKGRPDGINGRIKQKTELVTFRYHNTCIAHITPLGDVFIKNGGYNTRTTKKRINKIINPLGYRIIQRQFKWYIQRLDSLSPLAVMLSTSFIIHLQSEPIYKPTKMKGDELQ